MHTSVQSAGDGPANLEKLKWMTSPTTQRLRRSLPKDKPRSPRQIPVCSSLSPTSRSWKPSEPTTTFVKRLSSVKIGLEVQCPYSTSLRRNRGQRRSFVQFQRSLSSNALSLCVRINHRDSNDCPGAFSMITYSDPTALPPSEV